MTSSLPLVPRSLVRSAFAIGLAALAALAGGVQAQTA